jgi:hypothetical protein
MNRSTRLPPTDPDTECPPIARRLDGEHPRVEIRPLYPRTSPLAEVAAGDTAMPLSSTFRDGHNLMYPFQRKYSMRSIRPRAEAG